MLGLGDLSVTVAVIACLGVTLFGVIYGAVNWNRGDVDLPPQKKQYHPHRRHRKKHRH